ncbi:MAG: polyisoprenoid-binding protein [Myxococcales bacterium]|nr:polyisoprenoid-binding protein [Myxococcales bacterium]
MMSGIRAGLVSAALMAPGAALATGWEIDSSHTQSSFVVKHLMVANVRGEFGQTTGAIEIDDKDITKSTVEATIDATTVNTREPKRDAHLKSADFFEVDKHPRITFKSKKVTKGGKDKLKVVGELTIRGVTKDVTLDVSTSGEVKDPWGNVKRAFTATGKINRKDFGLVWNKPLETGGLLVGEEVDIQIDVEAGKKATKT